MGNLLNIILGIIITGISYMSFPLIKILINHGKFEITRAKRIALWNSIVVGTIFCILTSLFSSYGVWSATPAFIYYWINRKILSSNEKDQSSSGHKPSQFYKCAYCGNMGPYFGNCPECGSGKKIYLDDATTSDSDLLDEAPLQPQQLYEQTSSKKYCRKCGAKLIENSVFCSNCGTEL